MARSINSPGVQVIEKDFSQYQQIVGGTTVYVPGFASQGPIDETLLITSISELEQVYGRPQTAAERYFYHSCKEILNSPSTLLTTRLPYGSGSGEGFAEQYSALFFPVLSTADKKFEIGQPTYITMSEAEYNDVLQNNFVWSDISNTTTSASYTKSIGGSRAVLDAGLVIVNAAQVAQNEQLEGYYLSITDNSEWGPETDFTAVTKFYGLSANFNNSSIGEVFEVPSTRFNFPLSGAKDVPGSFSVSEVIERTITFNVNESFYNDSLVINLFRVRKNTNEPQELTYFIQETHIGSLDRNKDSLASNTGLQNNFIENVVNNSSNNLTVLVNPGISRYTDWSSVSGVNVPGWSVTVKPESRALFPNSVYTPTFLQDDTKKVGNVRAKLNRALTLVESPESVLLDVIVDAGISTIATNTITGSVSGEFFDDTTFYETSGLNDPSSLQVTTYKSVLNIFNNFVQNVRQDCVFIADPLRQIFINGENVKTLDRREKTFSQDIYKPLKTTFESLNSNYSVVYGNWVKGYDEFSDRNVWLPFSGFAAAAYARTDTFAQPWIAPAGLTRGIIPNILDVGFNPNQKQRDFLYTISINPVVFFSGDGYAIFGQKTLQTRPSAFDRVNVRRLFLVLERATQRALKYFVFEPNSEFTRTRLINTIAPIFELAKSTEGLFDYLIVCDERNNTPDIIDRNEMVVDIYIKPVKAAEFILVNFIATRTSQNFQELI